MARITSDCAVNQAPQERDRADPEALFSLQPAGAGPSPVAPAAAVPLARPCHRRQARGGGESPLVLYQSGCFAHLRLILADY